MNLERPEKSDARTEVGHPCPIFFRGDCLEDLCEHQMSGSDSDLASWMCRVQYTLKGSHFSKRNWCEASEINLGIHPLIPSEEKGSRVCTFPTLPCSCKHCGLWLQNNL